MLVISYWEYLHNYDVVFSERSRRIIQLFVSIFWLQLPFPRLLRAWKVGHLRRCAWRMSARRVVRSILDMKFDRNGIHYVIGIG